ncbi:MAG: nuclear transport factor 2 family protein [Planctomycetota bacterium]
MTTEQNVDILKKGYELWAKGDPAALDYWFDHMDDYIKWSSVVDESSTGMEFAEDCDAKTGVARYFEKLMATWELEFIDIHEYIAQHDRVVVLGTVKWRNRATGKSVETKKVDVIRMKDGKVTEFCEYYDTAKAIAASTD